MPHSRALPAVGRRCYELRIVDRGHNWRIVHRIDTDAVVIADVFDKRTRATPSSVIQRCRERLRRYDDVAREGARR
jgi:phage-related protein